ncbi:hypothetical protein D9M68_892240 [compost metagenome]
MFLASVIRHGGLACLAALGGAELPTVSRGVYPLTLTSALDAARRGEASPVPVLPGGKALARYGPCRGAGVSRR